MSSKHQLPGAQDNEQHNGHATIGPKATSHAGDDDAEPKGLPNSDRYHAETAHAPETHDPTQPSKKSHSK